VPSLGPLRSQPLTDPVPPPAESPGQAITAELPPPAADFLQPDELSVRSRPLAEILAPTQAVLRIEHGAVPDPPEKVMATLTEDALWIQGVWQLRMVPLHTLDRVEPRRNGTELTLTFRPEVADAQWTLAFASFGEGKRWRREILAQQQLSPAAPQADRQVGEGVTLVRQVPAVPHVVLGEVAFAGESRWAADRGLQLRAGMLGADAVLGVRRQRCPEVGWGARQATGLAVRLDDADTRKRLRLRWYFEEVCALVNRLLLLVVLQAVALFLIAAFLPAGLGLQMATGETPSQGAVRAAWGLGILYAWPLVLLVLLRALRWPQLLRAAGLVVLAVTTGRMLTVWLAHFLAARNTGSGLAGGTLWIPLDPVNWAFVIAGIVLCVRAWRLARDARHILPPDVQAVPTGRKVWARGLLTVTALYALAFLALAGVARYQTSAFLLQPGVDPQREQQALLALN
jgi:hypothetical protein